MTRVALRDTDLPYRRIADHVRQLLRNPTLTPGDPLPSERRLADEFDVSPMTARKALAMLVEEGLIERRVGRGTFVAERHKSTRRTEPVRRTIAAAFLKGQLADPLTAYAISGVRQILAQDDFVTDILEMDESGCTGEFVKKLIERGVHGLIHVGPIRPSAAKRMRDADIPFVKVGLPPDDPNVPCVSLDMRDLLEQMLSEARRFGHEEIGFVWWQSDALPSPVQPAIYAEACRRAGLVSSATRAIELPPPPRMDPACVDTSVVFSLDPMPTALIATDEYVAAALIRDLQAKGLRVGQDVSVMSLIAHTPQAQGMPLTAPNTAADRPKLFRLAAELLMRLMDGPAPDQLHWFYREKLQVAASLGPAS